jgi:hypothetical protein
MAIDFTELWEKTIQSQYGTSPHIKGIIESFAKRIDPTIDIETFYHDYFDPRTAVGVGLDIWGVIVGADRLIEVDSYDFFGLLGQNMSNMDNAPFWVEKGSTNIYRMSDPAFRELIFLKAYANIADATLPSIKYVINTLYPNGATAISAGHMKIRVIFLSYIVPAYSFALLKKYGLFNLGAGVGWEYYIVDPDTTFGFAGSGMQNFDNGIFAPYDINQVEEESQNGES